MFNLITVEDIVRVPPDKFNEGLMLVTYSELKAKYEGLVTKELGFVIAVVDVQVGDVGKIIPGDGATYHPVSFTLLSYFPEIRHPVVILSNLFERFL